MAFRKFWRDEAIFEAARNTLDRAVLCLAASGDARAVLADAACRLDRVGPALERHGPCRTPALLCAGGVFTIVFTVPLARGRGGTGAAPAAPLLSGVPPRGSSESRIPLETH